MAADPRRGGDSACATAAGAYTGCSGRPILRPAIGRAAGRTHAARDRTPPRPPLRRSGGIAPPCSRRRGAPRCSRHRRRRRTCCFAARARNEMNRGAHSVQDLLQDLKACSVRRDLQWGRRIHAKVAQGRRHSDIHLLTGLIKMYAKCGSMVCSRRVFDSIQKPDVISWNALLMGYAENGEGQVAFDMLARMRSTPGYAATSVTYIAALKACTSLAAYGGDKGACLERGRRIHSEIGDQMTHFVQSTLIDMYAKCGSMLEARSVFDSIQKPDVVSWDALLMGYAESGEGQIALDLFSRMKSDCDPTYVTYIAVLKACTSLFVAEGRRRCSLDRGREVHLEIGCTMNQKLQNALIDMYAKCGSMVEAHRVFQNMQKPDVFSWTALILGYAENGEAQTALDLFSRMKKSASAPTSVTYVAVLKACTSLAVNGHGKDFLDRGRQIHLELGSHLDPYVQCTLIDMYAKFGTMVEAHRVFDSMHNPGVVSWNALLLGYAENGDGLAALELFSRMKERGCAPDSITYMAALKACTSLGATGEGLQRSIEIRLEITGRMDRYVQNTLIDMYAKFGMMVEAHRVFDSIQTPSVVSWNALLLGYAENGEARVALELFSKMKASAECVPTPITYIAALKACGLTGDLPLGRRVHSEIREFTAHVVTCLVDFYGKCGSIQEAREAFDLHPRARTVTTWNALLAGYCTFGERDSVFKLFDAMQDEGFRPNAVTFVCLLLCCSHAGIVEKARAYFEAMPVQYRVTPTVTHYTCMVDALGRANRLNEAVEMIRRMPCNPRAVTWSALLAACRKWKSVEVGRMAFQSWVAMDKDAAAHMLMSHTYNVWEEQTVGGVSKLEQLVHA